jgi:hypothetical protein
MRTYVTVISTAFTVSTDIAPADAAEGESAAVVALEPDMAFL